MRNALALTILPLVVLACEKYPAGDETKENGRIAVTASALELPGVTDACYKLQVTNSLGEVLWTQDSVCSSRYGDGAGAITYVGTCDATNNPNQVSLTLLRLSDESGAAVSDFTNPCPEGAACTKTVACAENQDTPVAFDLTMMRNADQGFFDIAVTFEDLACSAKVDCVDGMLKDPESGARKETAVLAFACNAGDNAQAMRMSDITLDCDSPNGPLSITIDPSQGPGNYYSTHVHGDPHVDQASSWRTTGSSSSSWSVGIAPDLDALSKSGVTGCVLHAQATATKETELVWSPRSNYPYVEYSVPVVSRSADGSLSMQCGSHALDEPGSGVSSKLIGSGNDKYVKTGHVTLMK